MSVNTAHANNGVLIHAGEYILLHSDSVSMEFSGQDNPVFKGTKQGRIYLTSHRVIFNNKKPGDPMQSFSAPFISLSDVELEQPVFGANYIKGKVRAQPNGNFIGEVKFKLHFKAGGAIEYGQALMRAASTAQRNLHQQGGYSDDPPPYTPSGAWHEAPPPAYQAPPGYYGWLPTHDAFSGPAPNTVYMSDNPPPYPGIGGPPPYSRPPPEQSGPHCRPQQNVPDPATWNGFSAPPSNQPPQQAGGWGGGQQPPPYSAAPGYGAPGAPYGGAPGYAPPPGYGAPGGGYGAPGFVAPGASAPPGGGYHPAAGGFQGYPGGGPQQPPQQGGYPYPPPGGAAGGAAASAMGFSAPPANSKEAEAMASAYNTPYNQRSGTNASGSNDQPPTYNDLPPNYNDSSRKNQ